MSTGTSTSPALPSAPDGSDSHPQESIDLIPQRTRRGILLNISLMLLLGLCLSILVPMRGGADSRSEGLRIIWAQSMFIVGAFGVMDAWTAFRAVHKGHLPGLWWTHLLIIVVLPVTAGIHLAQTQKEWRQVQAEGKSRQQHRERIEYVEHAIQGSDRVRLRSALEELTPADRASADMAKLALMAYPAHEYQAQSKRFHPRSNPRLTDLAEIIIEAMDETLRTGELFGKLMKSAASGSDFDSLKWFYARAKQESASVAAEAVQAALPGAVSADYEGILQWMLEQGADPRGTELAAEIIRSGRSPELRKEMLKLVLRAGVDPNESGQSAAYDIALAVAAGNRDFASARQLLNAGANPNLKNDREGYGRWPLEAAVEADEVAMVSLLLRAGADRNQLVGSSNRQQTSIKMLATQRLAEAATPEEKSRRAEIVQLLTSYPGSSRVRHPSRHR